MERTRTTPLVGIIFLAVCMLILLLATVAAYRIHYYLPLTLTVLVLSMIPFFIRFEMKSLHAREVVLIAMLIAIAAVSRVPFSMIPSVQPTTFVIMVSGIVFGAESGFLIGAIAALVSNIFLGQGPWTPWQMFAWGMVGCTSGWLGRFAWMRRRYGMMTVGVLWGFLFGWIMNLTSIVTLQTFSLTAFLAIYGTSFYFDLLHALSNALFLGLFGVEWVKILQRFKKKYGML